jgi:hypothetical protein
LLSIQEKHLHNKQFYPRKEKLFRARKKSRIFFFVFKTFLGIFGEQEKKYDNLK